MKIKINKVYLNLFIYNLDYILINISLLKFVLKILKNIYIYDNINLLSNIITA